MEGVETEREQPKELSSKAKRQSTSLMFRKINGKEGRGHWFNSSVQHHLIFSGHLELMSFCFNMLVNNLIRKKNNAQKFSTSIRL